MSNDLRRPGDRPAGPGLEPGRDPPAAVGGPDDEEGATRLVSRDAAAAALRAIREATSTARRAQYRVGRRIGSGGFAEIYEADPLTPEGGAERVALKRLLPSMRADPMRRRHLMREAHIAAQL